jgi:hypothetical protein
VEASFRQAIQLWADERFESLWEDGQLASRYRVRREEGVWRVALEDLMTKPEVGLPWDVPGPG